MILKNSGVLSVKPNREGKYFSYLDKRPIQVIAHMPCPMKVPFKQIFSRFIESYNAAHLFHPVIWPELDECAHPEVNIPVLKAANENELPDIYLATGFQVIFNHAFYEKFVKSGIYTGYIDASEQRNLPDDILQALKQYNIGTLAFSSWGVVQDMSVGDNVNHPQSWADILKPDCRHQITVHGCHGKAGSFSLLMFLQQIGGEKAIANFAKNVIDMKHFAQIIKRMDSSDPKRTAFNVLPDVAASHIPSHKKIKRLHFQEGYPLNPLVFMVKTSRLEQCQPLIDFFHTAAFRKMLRTNGYVLASEIDWQEHYMLPDFEQMMTMGVDKAGAKIESLYQYSLEHDAIDRYQAIKT